MKTNYFRGDAAPNTRCDAGAQPVHCAFECMRTEDRGGRPHDPGAHMIRAPSRTSMVQPRGADGCGLVRTRPDHQ